VQTLLADRFKLTVHRETKELSAYVISVGKTAPKLFPPKEAETLGIRFTIPAGSVDAVFGNAKQVQLQTGTVAGLITATANLSVAAVDVTPNPAPTAKMTVPAGAPQLLNVQVIANIVGLFLSEKDVKPRIFIDTRYQIWVDGITWSGKSAVI
jgi:hypothetical protein